jgi:thymidine kinase
MFSDKTETLIHMARAIPVEERGVYKPITDTRHMECLVVSHAGNTIPAEWVDLDLKGVKTEGITHLFLDEAQFLSETAISKIQDLLRMGIDVTVTGLDLDYRAQPFGIMPTLLAYADVVLKLTSKCQCGRDSTRTHRKVKSDDLILIGGEESYDTLCLLCYHTSP